MNRAKHSTDGALRTPARCLPDKAQEAVPPCSILHFLGFSVTAPILWNCLLGFVHKAPTLLKCMKSFRSLWATKEGFQINGSFSMEGVYKLSDFEILAVRDSIIAMFCSYNGYVLNL